MKQNLDVSKRKKLNEEIAARMRKDGVGAGTPIKESPAVTGVTRRDTALPELPYMNAAARGIADNPYTARMREYFSPYNQTERHYQGLQGQAFGANQQTPGQNPYQPGTVLHDAYQAGKTGMATFKTLSARDQLVNGNAAKGINDPSVAQAALNEAWNKFAKAYSQGGEYRPRTADSYISENSGKGWKIGNQAGEMRDFKKDAVNQAAVELQNKSEGRYLDDELFEAGDYDLMSREGMEKYMADLPGQIEEYEAQIEAAKSRRSPYELHWNKPWFRDLHECVTVGFELQPDDMYQYAVTMHPERQWKREDFEYVGGDREARIAITNEIKDMVATEGEGGWVKKRNAEVADLEAKRDSAKAHLQDVTAAHGRQAVISQYPTKYANGDTSFHPETFAADGSDFEASDIMLYINLMNNGNSEDKEWMAGVMQAMGREHLATNNYADLGLDFLTPQEVGYFNAEWNANHDPEAIMKMAETYRPIMAQRRQEYLRNAEAYAADQYGLGYDIYNNTVNKTLEGLEGVRNLGATILGNDTVRTPGSIYYDRTNASQYGYEWRREQAETSLPGRGGGLYDVGTGLTSQLWNMGTAGAVGKALGGLGLVDDAVNASKRAYEFGSGLPGLSGNIQEGYERGYDDWLVAASALLDYAIEAGSEHIGVDNLFDNSGRFLKTIATAAVTEPIEEVAGLAVGDMTSDMIDAATGRRTDDEELFIQAYRETGSVDEASAAVAKANQEKVSNTIIQSALIGGAIGVPAAANVNAYQRKTGKSINKYSNAGVLTDIAMTLPEDSEAHRIAATLKEQQKSGKRPSNGQLGRLYQATAIALDEESNSVVAGAMNDAIVEEMVGMGENEEVARRAAPILSKQLTGEKLTKADMQTLAESTYATTMMEELNKFNEGGKEGEETKESPKWADTANAAGNVAGKKQMGRVAQLSSVFRPTTATAIHKASSDSAKLVSKEHVAAGVKDDTVTIKGEDGKAQEAKLLKIAANKDGVLQAVVQGADGEQVAKSYTELQYKSEDAARITSYAMKNAGGNAELANLMLQGYTGGDSEVYLAEFDAAYRAGYDATAVDAKSMAKFSKGIAKEAFQLGKKQAEAAEAERLENVGKGRRGTGTVTLAPGITEDSLEPEQKNAYHLMQHLAKETGIDVLMYNSAVDSAGYYGSTVQGSFRRSTNAMTLDLNSGRVKVGDSQKYAILRTASHELTHFIEGNSKENYAKLRQFIADELARKGENFNALVQAKIDESMEDVAAGLRKMPLTRGGAIAEVVADGCEMMLRDSKAIERMHVQDKGLAEKVKDFLQEFADRIRKAFEGINPESREARALMEQADGVYRYADELVDLWDAGLIESVQARRGATEPGELVPETEQFKMNRPVERRKDGLIAVHNLNGRKLMDTLELGAFPMPSIAVVKAEHGHDDFGEYSVIFAPETIDPQKNKANRVYGNDAWTPIFPQVEREINSDKLYRVAANVENAAGKIADEYERDARRFFNEFSYQDATRHQDDFVMDRAWSNDGIIAAYMQDHGEQVEILQHDVPVDRGYNIARADQYDKILEIAGETDLSKVKGKDVFELYGDKLSEISPFFARGVRAFRDGDRREAVRVLEIVREAQLYKDAGRDATPKTRRENDYGKTATAMRDRIDRESFNGWIMGRMDGVFGGKGIRNSKDLYTPSGNRRSFKATHDAYTAENVVRVMLQQDESSLSASDARGLKAAASSMYSSLDDIRADAGRLREISETEYNAILARADNELRDFLNAIEAWDYEDQEDAGNLLVKAAKRKMTPAKMATLFRENGFPKATTENAQIGKRVLDQLQNIPTGYFEAKPARVVSFDEIRMVVAPDSMPANLAAALQERGIPFTTYDGTKSDRLAKMNAVEDVQFSRKKTKPPDIPVDDIAHYDRPSYNKYGWTNVHHILDRQHQRQYLERLPGEEHGLVAPRTSEGGYIVYVSDTIDGAPRVAIVTDGDWNDPSILRVYRIKKDSATETTFYQEAIEDAEANSHRDAVEIIRSRRGDGVIDAYSREDFPSYYEMQQARSMGDSGKSGRRNASPVGGSDNRGGDQREAGQSRFVNDDNRYAHRTPSPATTRDYLLSLTDADLRTAGEKDAMARYKRLADELADLELERARYLETAASEEGDERIKAQNRAEIKTAQIKRLKDRIQGMERTNVFKPIMAEARAIVEANRMMESGKTMEQALQRLTARMQADADKTEEGLTGLDSQLKAAVAKVERLNRSATAAAARGMFAPEDIERRVQAIVYAHGNALSKNELRNRISLMAATYWSDLEGDGPAKMVEMAQDLAKEISTRSKAHYRSWTLDAIRGTVNTFSLNDKQMQELRHAGYTINGMRSELAGVIKYSPNASSLDSNWGELCAAVPSLDADAPDGEQIMQLLDLVAHEKQLEQDFEYGNAAQVEAELLATLMDLPSPKKAKAAGVAMVNALKANAQESSDILRTLEGSAAKASAGLKRAVAAGVNVQAITDEANAAVEYYKALYQQQTLEMAKRTRDAEDRVMAFRGKLSDAEERLRRFREQVKESRETRENTAAVRKRIVKMVKALDKLRRHETDYKHVPEELKPVVNALVSAFAENSSMVFDSKRAEQIADAYRKLKELDSDLSAFYDEDIQEMIEYVTGLLAYHHHDKATTPSAKALKLGDLEIIENIVSHIYAMVKQSNKAFVDGSMADFAEIAQNVADEMVGRRDARFLHGTTGAARGLDDLIRNGNMLPVYYFDNLGNSQMRTMGYDILRGQDQYGLMAHEDRATMSDIRKRYNYHAWSNEAPVTFNIGGKEITLTKEQVLWVYATAKREATNELAQTHHLDEGGIVFETGKQKTKGLWDPSKQPPIRLNADAVRKITDTLTAEQKSYADDVVQHMSTTVGERGNATSMQMFGYRKYREKYYFPYQTARDQRHQTSVSNAVSTTDDARLRHQSFSNPLKKGANTPLVVGNFSDVAASHMNAMNTYAAMVVPIENMNRVLNRKVDMDDSTTTIRALMAQKYGDSTKNYLEKLLTDLNGGVQVDRREGFSGALVSIYKGGAVSGSMSVVLQQWTSIFRAATMIDPKYFVTQAPFFKGEWEELAKYSGIASIKDMGRFDVGIGRTGAEWIGADADDFTVWQKAQQMFGKDASWQTVKTRWDDVFNFLPGWADRVTWAQIWRAVKAEQAAQHPEMDANSDAFKRMCAERFNDVVNHTQVYDSVMTRSQLMRGKGDMSKMITAFASEPTLTLNMLYDAAHNPDQKGWKKRSKYAAAAVTANVLSQVFASAMQALASAWRKDDDERKGMEKFLDKFGENVFDNLNPFTMFPMIRDIYTTVSGQYEVERIDMEFIRELFRAGKKVFKGEMTAWQYAEEGLGTLAKVFHVPVKNVLRDLRSAYNAVTSDWSAPKASNASHSFWHNRWFYDDSNKAYYERYVNAINSGDKKLAADTEAYMKESKMVDDFDGGVRDVIKNRFKAGKLTEDESIDWLVDHGLADNARDAYSKVAGWQKQEGETGGAYLDVRRAMSPYNADALDAAVDEMISYGYKKKEVQSEVRGIAKKMYQDGLMTWERYAEIQAAYGGETDADDLYWQKQEADYDGEGSYSRFGKLWDGMTSNNTAAVKAAEKQLTEHGYTTKQVASQKVSLIGSAYKNGEINWQQAEKMFKTYTDLKDANDLFWKKEALDYKGEGTYSEYRGARDSLLAGDKKGFLAEKSKLLSHGKTGEGVNRAVGELKDELLDMYETDPAAARQLRAMIVWAYVQCGKTEANANKIIDGWFKEK